MDRSSAAAICLRIVFTALLVATIVALVGLYARLVGDTHGGLVHAVAGVTLAAMVALAVDPLIAAICDGLLARSVGAVTTGPKLMLRAARARRNTRG